MDAPRKKRKKSRKKKGQSTTGSLLLVLALLILIGVVSFRYRDNIGKGESTVRPPVTEDSSSSENAFSQSASSEPHRESPQKQTEPSVTVVKTKEEPEITEEKASGPETDKPATDKQETKKPDRRPNPQEERSPVSPQIKTEEKQLFFVRYSESTESIEIVPVIRRISYEASPLTQTLNTLLYGPNVSELSRNLVTMIPDKTKILSIKIEKGIATINFNEAFMFNSNGREGMEAQLAQIVYTATQFPTVSAVQFLIEGEKKSYLTDGSYIELPLSRDSF